MAAMTKRGFRGGLHVAGPEGEGPFDPVDLDRQDHAARDLVDAKDRADVIDPGRRAATRPAWSYHARIRNRSLARIKAMVHLVLKENSALLQHSAEKTRESVLSTAIT